MQGTDMTQLGIAAVVVILVLREVFSFIKTLKFGTTNVVALPREYLVKFDRLVDETADLHRMHNVFDKDNRPVWYVKASLETAITELSKNITTQSIILQKMVDYLVRAEENAKNHDEKLDRMIYKNKAS